MKLCTTDRTDIVKIINRISAATGRTIINGINIIAENNNKDIGSTASLRIIINRLNLTNFLAAFSADLGLVLGSVTI